MEEKTIETNVNMSSKKISKKRINKKLIIIIVILIISVVAVAIFLLNKKSKIVGKWCYEKGTAWCYNFKEDGTGTYGMDNSKNPSDIFTYTFENEVLKISYENGNTSELKVEFSEDNSKITLDNGAAQANYVWTEEVEAKPAEKVETEEIEETEEEKAHREEMEKELEEHRKKIEEEAQRELLEE